MSERPYMKLYVADYLGDTRHLTTEQHGAYLLLLMSMWRAGGELPKDDKKLARIAGTSTRKWRSMASEILPFFEEKDGKITQKRLQKELAHARTVSAKRAQAGAAKSLNFNEPIGANDTTKDTTIDEQLHPNARESESRVHRSNIAPNGAIVGAARADPPERLPVQQAYELYNLVAQDCDLPKAKGDKPTPERAKKIRARLRDHGFDVWKLALTNLAQSEFLLGKNDKGWRADLDFVLQPKSFNRLIEGFYQNETEGV